MNRAVLQFVEPFLTVHDREELAYRPIHKASGDRSDWLGVFELYGDQPLPLMERRVGEYRACAFPEKHLAPLRESAVSMYAFEPFFNFYRIILACCHPDEGMRDHARKVLDVNVGTTDRNPVSLMIIRPYDEYMKVQCSLRINEQNVLRVFCHSFMDGELYTRGFVTLLSLIEFVEGVHPTIDLHIYESTSADNDAWVGVMNRFYDSCIAQLPKQTFAAEVRFWNWRADARVSIDDKLMELFPWCTVDNLARVAKYHSVQIIRW